MYRFASCLRNGILLPEAIGNLTRSSLSLPSRQTWPTHRVKLCLVRRAPSPALQPSPLERKVTQQSLTPRRFRAAWWSCWLIWAAPSQSWSATRSCCNSAKTLSWRSCTTPCECCTVSMWWEIKMAFSYEAYITYRHNLKIMTNTFRPATNTCSVHRTHVSDSSINCSVIKGKMPNTSFLIFI